MNSTMLRILAVLLAVGAVATAWIGYRLSTQAPPAAQLQAAPPTFPQVVAARDVPAGQLLTADDVHLVSAPQRDAHGYDSVQDVIGKLTMQPVTQGTPLISSHFPSLGMVAQALHPGERGVAVQVNEVIGVGGFVNPGDYVDVLLYLRADRETNDVSSAQVVLRNVRVLAFGENAGAGADDELPALEGKGAESKPADATKKTDTKKSKASRSAILAVPEKEATRLMLAASSGTLRLALRGAEPPQQEVQGEDPERFLRLDEVARAAAQRPIAAKPQTIASKSAKSKRAAAAAEKKSQVIVHQGDKVEVVSVGN